MTTTFGFKGGPLNPNVVVIPYFQNDTHTYGVGVSQPGKYFLAGTVTITNGGVETIGEVGTIGITSAILHTNGTPAFDVNATAGTTPCIFKNLTFSGNFFDMNNCAVLLRDGFDAKFEYVNPYYVGTGIILSNQQFTTIE